MNIHEMDPMTVAPQAMQQIGSGGGALLTAKDGERINTMTIGWATIGIIWGRPIMEVAVRKTRHTFGIIEQAADFTVSIPAGGELAEALTFCGTRSGRECDKFRECGLNTVAAQKVITPVIECSGLHYECTIVHASAMDPARLSDEINDRVYPKEDYHTMYYGQIAACYMAE